MEGAMIRGGLALGEGSSVKMGAKLYGANTFGPHCKIGGEVTNSIFQGYSNKGHDGYLGNSVIGEWCNFGADTNSSNLKNNYKKVSIYNHKTDTLIDSGQQFLGLIMGDHSKTGINTMLNTGTVVGVSSEQDFLQLMYLHLHGAMMSILILIYLTKRWKWLKLSWRAEISNFLMKTRRY